MIEKLVNKAVHKATKGKGLKRNYSLEKKALKMYKNKNNDKQTIKEIKDLASKIVNKKGNDSKSKTPDSSKSLKKIARKVLRKMKKNNEK